jgi:predicted outer membrane protein
MHKSVVIGALSGAILFAVAASAADQAAKPTDPHIAYTAGKIDIEAAQQALNSLKTRMSAPLPKGWLGTTLR